MKISQELSEKIQAIFHEYISKSEADWVDSDKTIDLRKIAAELNVLPLYLDWSGAFGIRLNGEFFSFSYEKPYKIKTDYNQREINGILFQSLKKYPDLRELMPLRTINSIECSSCNGTGIEPMNEKLGFAEERIVCYCGGLGWLPSQEN
ncbi:MAG: hypothetical protein ABJA66_09940 [Actinomycetota bacterium]